MSISISQVKSWLGESTNSLKGLCTSSKINMFSAAKPGTTHWKTGSTINFYWTAPTSNFKLGDFNGYNHNAVCAFISTSHSGNIANASGSGTATFTTKYEVRSGCLNLYNVFGSGWRIAHKVGSTYYYGSTFTSSNSQSLTSSVSFSSPGTYYVETYLYKDGTYVFLPISSVSITVTKTYTAPSIQIVSAVYSTMSRSITVRVKFNAGSDAVTFNSHKLVVKSNASGYFNNSMTYNNPVIVSAGGSVTSAFGFSGNNNIASWTCTATFETYLHGSTYRDTHTVNVTSE